MIRRALAALAAIMMIFLFTAPCFSAPKEEKSLEPLTQSRPEGFSRGYALTGDGAADVVSIALAQENKTGAEFGYSEEWCADFVGDCALLAGQSAAVPPYGGVAGLKTRILSAGGSYSTSNPLPGDVCFIDWDCAGGYAHVEIVYRVEGQLVYTIGGNSSDAPNLYSRIVKKHAPLNGGAYGNCITCILRPSYQPREVSCAERCTPYPCYAELTANGGAELRTLPCLGSVDPASSVQGVCADGEELTATGLLRNTADEYWYRVERNGGTLYVYAGNISGISFLWDVRTEDISAPTNLNPGASFSIQGFFRTDLNELTRVSSFVYAGSATEGTPLTGAGMGVRSPRYYLRLSTLDYGTVFGILPAGRYTLVYAAEAVS